MAAFTPFKYLAICLCTFSLAACASKPQAPENIAPETVASETHTDHVIAVDLISAMRQMPDFDAWSTTVQMSEPLSGFGSSIRSFLKDSGYGVQKVSADQGQHYVSYSKSVSESESGVSTEFKINVNRLTLSRQYKLIGNNTAKQYWVPDSPLLIKGVAANNVSLSDELLFKHNFDVASLSRVLFLDNYNNIINTAQAIPTDTPTSSINYNQGARASSSVANQANIFNPTRSDTWIDSNEYIPVSEVVLTFPTSDSTLLGGDNKATLAKLASIADNFSYGFSIQECSNRFGQNSSRVANQVMKRQQRVYQELIIAGIKPGVIKAQTCSIYDRSVPENSVLLTVFNQLSNL